MDKQETLKTLEAQLAVIDEKIRLRYIEQQKRPLDGLVKQHKLDRLNGNREAEVNESIERDSLRNKIKRLRVEIETEEAEAQRIAAGREADIKWLRSLGVVFSHEESK